LSLSVLMATGGLLWLGSDEAAERAEVEIEIFRGEAEARPDVADRVFQLHQRAAHGLRLFRRQRVGLHPTDGLAFHELAQKFHEREHEARDRPLHVLRIGVPAWRR